MSRPIRCSKCGSSSAEGGEFQLLIPYRAYGISVVIAVEDDGTLTCEGLDRGDAERFYTPSLTCYDCGHEWPTSREWRHR